MSYEYTDFSETTAKGDFYNEICYTGGIYDKTTGLYYLNARYYDPDDGRFVTQDTYRGDMNDPSSLHLYAYCANNPVNYVDPSGHFSLKVNTKSKVITASVAIWFASAYASKKGYKSAKYTINYANQKIRKHQGGRMVTGYRVSTKSEIKLIKK